MEYFKYCSRLLSAIMTLFAIFGCSTPGTQPAAIDSLAAIVRSGMIVDGKAHVYAFLGKVHSTHLTASHRDSSNFIVNGECLGGISRNECMFIEIPPGTYTFSFQERTPIQPARTNPVTFNIEADQNVFVAFDIFIRSRSIDYMMLGAAGGPPAVAAGSAAGALAASIVFDDQVVDKSEEGVKTIQHMKIVLPDSIALEKIQPLN